MDIATPLQSVSPSESQSSSEALNSILEFLDPGTFQELDALAEHGSNHFGTDKKKTPGDGLITGHGLLDGQTVLVYAHDASFLGGSSGQMHAKKLVRILDLALQIGVPIIGFNNSSGIRIHEGVDAGTTFGEVFYKTVKASGVVPQISLILGDCAGGAAYTPALTDFIIMIDTNSTMFLTSPTVIRKATGEQVTKEQIGGGQVHASTTGLAHFLADSKSQALSIAKALLAYLPQNNCSSTLRPGTDTGYRDTSSLSSIVPSDPNLPFDMRELIYEIADNKEFLEIQALFAQNIIIGFLRIGGESVGIVASQPSHMAGCLSVDASHKAARFVRTCDAFSIPILTLLDVPGYLPGLTEETGGIIGAGAKLLHAYCEATVRKVSIIVRKAYGGAYPTLANRSATDFIYALPGSEISIMGPEGAVDIIFRKEINTSSQSDVRRSELIKEYRQAHASAEYSARKSHIDGLISHDQVRNTLISSFGLLRDKITSPAARKHSNIQL